MVHPLIIAGLLALLVPVEAEAAKFRGGSRSSVGSDSSDSRGAAGSVLVTPRIGRTTRAERAASTQPGRVPFPPATTAQPVQLTTTERPSAWCRSEVVVGGFCMMN